MCIVPRCTCVTRLRSLKAKNQEDGSLVPFPSGHGSGSFVPGRARLASAPHGGWQRKNQYRRDRQSRHRMAGWLRSPMAYCNYHTAYVRACHSWTSCGGLADHAKFAKSMPSAMPSRAGSEDPVPCRAMLPTPKV